MVAKQAWKKKKSLKRAEQSMVDKMFPRVPLHPALTTLGCSAARGITHGGER